MRALWSGALLAMSMTALTAAGGARQAPPAAVLHLPPLDLALPERVERIYQAVSPRVEADRAMRLVQRMAPLWRLAGNPQFDQSLEWIAAELAGAGIATRYETIPTSGQGWEMRDAVLRLDGPAGEVVLSRDQDRVPLAINSVSTPPGGALLALVDVGRGTDAGDYEGRPVAGAVVLAGGPIGSVWNLAVRTHGAAGVISTQLAPYTRPEETPDVLQWGSIPYGASRRSFGFRPRRARPAGCAGTTAGPTRVHVTVDTVFHRQPARSLIAGSGQALARRPRRARVAHVQEPGANDSASGNGTLLAVAVALRARDCRRHPSCARAAHPP
ncbi:MAG: hypothetical protein R2712_04345 [Vicinamibacterales bacterium]